MRCSPDAYRLSASGHDLCRRLRPAFVSMIGFVDTSDTTDIIMPGSIGAQRYSGKAAFTGGILPTVHARRCAVD